MADLEHNEFVEAIFTLIISRIEQLQRYKKQSEENTILDYLQKRENDINQHTLSLGKTFPPKNGNILNKPSSTKNSYKINTNTTEKIAATLSPLENSNTPLSTSPKEFCMAHKDNYGCKIKEIEHINAEVCAIRAFILEQHCVIKNFVEDIRSETVAPNILELIEALKEEIRHLRNKNSTKTSIIKF